MNHDIIHKFCRYHNIKKYTINNDDSIDVNDSVVFINSRMKRIPIKFNKVYGSFYCGNNRLTIFENFPIEVGLNFNCSHNSIKSLEGCPKYVGGYFTIYNNLIDIIDNFPQTIRKNFNICKSPLKSLGNYNLSYNLLICDNKELLISKHIKDKRKDKINKLNLL